MRLCYKDQLINAVQGNNRCLFREIYDTHKHINADLFYIKASVRCAQAYSYHCALLSFTFRLFCSLMHSSSPSVSSFSCYSSLSFSHNFFLFHVPLFLHLFFVLVFFSTFYSHSSSFISFSCCSPFFYISYMHVFLFYYFSSFSFFHFKSHIQHQLPFLILYLPLPPLIRLFRQCVVCSVLYYKLKGPL
jgi:hypothetical protein